MENVGSLEGKYEVLEKLHEGGMGAIYKVRHRLLDEIRVIKVMRPQHEDDEGLRARFLREAQMAVKLRHPHIAQMYDFALDEGGRGFIVMEYVEGISLQQMLQRIGAPTLGLALDVTRQTLTALGFLHRKGIVHRDISPDNIMVTKDDLGRPSVKLIDLGVAKVVSSKTGLTVSGTFLGKLLYASPEQFGQAGTQVDQRSDIYSFGCVMYELYTGKHPFPGTSPQELIAGHLVNAPLDFAGTDPAGRVPDDLRQIVLKAVAKRQDDRYASADDLDQALVPVQARFEVDLAEFERAMQPPETMDTMRIPIVAPGSTQERINAQFGLGSTPQPISLAESPVAQSTTPTVLTSTGGTSTSTMPTRVTTSAPATGQGTQPTMILPENLPPTAAAPQAQPASPASPRAPKPAAKKGAPWLLIGGAGAAVVVVAALFAGRGLLKSHAGPVAPPTPAASAPQPAAPAEAPAEPAPAPAPDSARAAIVPADVEKAIAEGAVDRLRGFAAQMTKEERAAVEASPNGAQRLDLVRRCVEEDAAIAKAAKGKDWDSALQHASALLALLPNSRQAKQAREGAAAALEGEAETLHRKGQTDAAIAKLQAVQRSWPNRSGLEARLTGLHAAHEADQRLSAALAAAQSAEKERRPEKGLEALGQVTPDERWQERFKAERQRLDALLAELDKAPPAARLKPGLKTDYSKGKPFPVVLVVTDDYLVKSVTVMARQEGAASYQEIPVQSGGGDEYTVEISPEFHGNKTVELYAVATDFAGHTSQLGTPEQPLRFKKKWSLF